MGSNAGTPVVAMTITVIGELSEATFANPLLTAWSVVPGANEAKRKVFGNVGVVCEKTRSAVTPRSSIEAMITSAQPKYNVSHFPLFITHLLSKFKI